MVQNQLQTLTCAKYYTIRHVLSYQILRGVLGHICTHRIFLLPLRRNMELLASLNSPPASCWGLLLAKLAAHCESFWQTDSVFYDPGQRSFCSWWFATLNVYLPVWHTLKCLHWRMPGMGMNHWCRNESQSSQSQQYMTAVLGIACQNCCPHSHMNPNSLRSMLRFTRNQLCRWNPGSDEKQTEVTTRTMPKATRQSRNSMATGWIHYRRCWWLCPGSEHHRRGALMYSQSTSTPKPPIISYTLSGATLKVDW